MILYHTSSMAVVSPEVVRSRSFLDFGKGFYLTTLREQAERYAQRFIRRKLQAWLNIYEFNADAAGWKTRYFEGYDGEWLEFVSACRAGEDTADYDLVVGGIANDKVIETLDRYFLGELSKDDALGLLKFEKPNNQYCIRSQKMIDECLTHIESLRL